MESTNSSRFRRVNVNFSDSAMEALRTLADRRGKTVSDVLRDSIALAKWIDEQTRAGWTLIREDADGTRTRVVFL